MLIIKENKKDSFIMKHTDSWIYYIHDYYPVRKFRYISEEKESMSRKIWAYKEQTDEQAFYDFTEELMYCIKAFARNTRYQKIGLVAVPPSKVGKTSAVRESIELIYQWAEEGTEKGVRRFDKKLYDYSGLLERISDISTAHQGRRATYDEQRESIRCIRNRLYRYHTAFVILDDVTTTSMSMNVCKDILLANGCKEDMIFRLAIAKTV